MRGRAGGGAGGGCDWLFVAVTNGDRRTEPQERRAADLGPSDVTASTSPELLTQAAGLTVVVKEDVTDAFRATCAALVAARRDLEDELRADEGDDFYEEERRKKNAMLQGIDEGILCRSLVVANK